MQSILHCLHILPPALRAPRHTPSLLLSRRQVSSSVSVNLISSDGTKSMSELKAPSFMSKPQAQNEGATSTVTPAAPSAPSFDATFTPGVIERRPLFG